MIQASTHFPFTEDNFRCIHIAKTEVTPEEFVPSFLEFLQKQRERKIRGVTLTLRADQCQLIPLARKTPLEMQFHNTDEAKSITLTKWLIEGPCRFPRFCVHKVMAGGFVFNLKTGKILLMQGRNSLNPAWKLPGGGVDPHQYIKEGAVREVKEETGVGVQGVGILGQRQAYKALFDVRSVYYIVLCCTEEEEINIIDQEETLKAEWFSISEILGDKMKLQLTFSKLVSFLSKVCQKWKIEGDGLELFSVLKEKYVEEELIYTGDQSSEERYFRRARI